MNLIKSFKKLVCRYFCHKPVIVHEGRPRYRGHYWNPKDVRYVWGVYEQCQRCGKKLSAFQRTYY